MRKTLPFTVLLASLLAGACSDSGPAGDGLSPTVALARSRNAPVDGMIQNFFPKGLETATGTRFDNIDAKLGGWNGTQWTGDVAVARTQLAELIKFVKNKSREIDLAALQPGEDQNAAGARLALAMFTYVYDGPDATPPPLAAGATDVVFDIVPAGAAALIQTPSQLAGLRLDEGSTLEDRVIVIARRPVEEEFTARCSGPLATDRCQYKHFYKFESFPLLKLAKSGRFAVCHVFGSNGPTEVEDTYIQLAHNLPADPANYTDGAIQEGQIELLPKAGSNTGVVNCSEPTTTASGVRGAGQRALYAIAKLAAKVIAPKALYAYNLGPEHQSDFFSDFVGVGAPNFVGTWNGTTRPTGSTSTGQPVTVVITSQTDAGVVGEYRVAQVGEPPFVAYNSRPSDGLGRFISSSFVGFNGVSFTIDPFFSPFSNGIKLEQSLTRTLNEAGVPVISGTTVRTSLIGEVLVTDTWELTLTKGEPALVAPPLPLISLRAAPTGATANSTSDAPIQ
jgi:hypothetical protein